MTRPPRDPALDAFVEHFGIRPPPRADLGLLQQVGEALSQLPYENLSKLIRKHRFPPGPARRRQPAEVIAEHVELGTGGTCFALTRMLSVVLEGLGLRCHPVLCDMRQRPQSHCALLVTLADGEVYLIDPGYLVHRPLRLPWPPGRPRAGAGVEGAAVVGDAAGCELWTGGKLRYRFTPLAPTAQRFEAVWDASFDWTMMNDVHVCSGDGGRGSYGYVHGHKLRRQQGDAHQTINIRGRQSQVIAADFGIAPRVIEEAYALVAHEQLLAGGGR